MKSISLLIALLTGLPLGLSCAAPAPGDTTQLNGPIKSWVVLAPFPNPEIKPGDTTRGAFDFDYLRDLGGEAGFRMESGKSVSVIGPDGKKHDATAKTINTTGNSLDFLTLFPSPKSDHQLAYVYTELQSRKAQDISFFLGSDDGVKVWVNGKLTFDTFPPAGRGYISREDEFTVRLRKGVNTVLVKIENGIGGWELGMEAYDKSHALPIEAAKKTAAMEHEIQNGELTLANAYPGYVFYPKTPFPKIVWRDADAVRRVAGDVPLKVRWFDSKLNEVTLATEPGRYMAYIEAKMPDGKPIKRAMTVYCAPHELDIWLNKGLQVPYFGKPFDPIIWKTQSATFREYCGSILSNGFNTMEDGAIFLSWLSEIKPESGPVGVTESPAVVNDDCQLALKIKLAGLTDKTRPLALPKLRATPAEVLHEGTDQEAGVKPDAKERIDAVCSEWADKSNEPFTILVARHGVIITHAAFGKDRDGKPIDLKYDPNHIASITKTLTGILFSQFLDQGFVQLDDPIGKVLPDFPTTGDKVITFRELFTHTTGLDGHGNWGGIHNPYLDNAILDGLDTLNPGGTFNYNGMGYDLSGKAMEMMTGKSIIRLFHENLYRPLGIQNISMSDLAYGAQPTVYELGILAQWLANHGSYGDKQFISEETFRKMLPEKLNKYYKSIDEEWGIGLTPWHDQKPGTPDNSKDPKDMIFGPNVIGHGSATSCILRVDLDKDLVIVQVRRTAGEHFGEYQTKFFMAIADSLLHGRASRGPTMSVLARTK